MLFLIFLFYLSGVVIFFSPDDRFILKQIKSIEISAFEDFAPRYLDYITRAIEEKVCTYP